MQPLIEYANARVLRGDRIVLNGLSLRIDVDEHVAILGPNGSGKSTLIKTITRECYPQASDPPALRILGQDRWNVFELRAMLGIVSNDLIQSCTRDFPAREIIVSGFLSSIGVWPWHEVTSAMEQKTNEVMELLEIQHLADRNVDQMSSGESRRVVIARALVHNPTALILDEPTNSLDLHSLHELREALRKIVSGGTSIVMVTHNLADIIPEIERVILVQDGRVVGDGPKAEMLTSSRLSELFRTHVEVMHRDGYYQAW